jgi:hypothetical protein
VEVAHDRERYHTRNHHVKGQGRQAHLFGCSGKTTINKKYDYGLKPPQGRGCCRRKVKPVTLPVVPRPRYIDLSWLPFLPRLNGSTTARCGYGGQAPPLANRLGLPPLVKKMITLYRLEYTKVYAIIISPRLSLDSVSPDGHSCPWCRHFSQ